MPDAGAVALGPGGCVAVGLWIGLADTAQVIGVSPGWARQMRRPIWKGEMSPEPSTDLDLSTSF